MRTVLFWVIMQLIVVISYQNVSKKLPLLTAYNLVQHSSDNYYSYYSIQIKFLHCGDKQYAALSTSLIWRDKNKSLKSYNDSDTSELMKARKPLHNIIYKFNSS